MNQPTTKVGLNTSQANKAMKSDEARKKFGVDGTGITIGVLSDSYNTSLTAKNNASDDIASGDLPAGIKVLKDGTNPRTDIDEGRAMLQLIHDIAPGAKLVFHTAAGEDGQEDFAKGIRALAAAGADIIVDDVIYPTEPMFQDGPVAQAVDEVVANGVAYFSSAGNNARQSYESAFNPSGETEPLFGKTYEWHDFDPGAGIDTHQAITVSTGALFSFQWDQPFKSFELGRGSASDLDIFVYDANKKFVGKIARPNIGGDPIEAFRFPRGGSFNIRIGKAKDSGPNPGLMKYVVFGDVTINEYNTASPTSFGHANAAGASSVGAAAYFNTPAFGVNPPRLNSFSSAGGIDILFNTAGNRLAKPESRQNVDIVAPDETNTTFFGRDIPNDTDRYPNFSGTSAAAPHAAAVAALMLEAAGGSGRLTPSKIYSTLEKTAINMGAPGYDNDTGYGLIDANAAVAAVTPPTIEFSQATYSVGEGDGTTNVVTLTRSSTTGTSEVQVSITGGTATGGRDYNNSSFPLKVVFSAGEKSKTIEVPIFEDTIYEPTAETIDFSVTTVSNAKIGTQNTTTFNINDNDSQSIIIGRDNQDDHLRGTADGEHLDGLGGNDKIEGFEGDDTLFGGQGNDRLHGGRGHDSLIGGEGDDRLIGGIGDGNDTLDGGEGNDDLRGGKGADTFILRPGDGKDTIRDFENGIDSIRVEKGNSAKLQILSQGRNISIKAGDETLAVLEGVSTISVGDLSIIGQDDQNDRLFGTLYGERLDGLAGDDKIVAGKGDDTLFGGQGNDSLHGGHGHDSIIGGDGDNNLVGGSGDGNDTLIGGIGNNNFRGGNGDDLLIGGGGNNIFHGGGGVDIFIPTPDGKNTIRDFENDTDLIGVEGGSSAKLEIVSQGGNTSIKVGDKTQVTLLDIDSSLINLDDFTDFF
ncbi:MAG: S8 family serine peptidase [Hormoscilla sp. GM7CHS1pb]|nr:S8 family serine peptidase [Hormoscilla sp. GM7CHS1pb]